MNAQMIPHDAHVPGPTVTFETTNKTGLEEFSPRAKHPVLEMNFECMTEAVEKILDSQFVHVQAALYHLSATLPIRQAKDSKVLNEVLDLINTRFERVEKEMEAELSRYKHIAKDEGVSIASAYTHQGGRTLQIFCPEMARWVSMLKRADEILRWVDSLWYSTFISSRDRTAIIMNWRNRLIGFSREMTNLHKRANGYQTRVETGEAAPSRRRGKVTALPGLSVEESAQNDDVVAPAPASTPRPKTAPAKGKATGRARSKTTGPADSKDAGTVASEGELAVDALASS